MKNVVVIVGIAIKWIVWVHSFLPIIFLVIIELILSSLEIPIIIVILNLFSLSPITHECVDHLIIT